MKDKTFKLIALICLFGWVPILSVAKAICMVLDKIKKPAFCKESTTEKNTIKEDNKTIVPDDDALNNYIETYGVTRGLSVYFATKSAELYDSCEENHSYYDQLENLICNTLCDYIDE